MSHDLNELGQPIGARVEGWTTPERPSTTPMVGRLCRLEPLHAGRHAQDLHAANLTDRERRNWTYLPYGPFESQADYAAWVASVAGADDPQFWAVVDRGTGKATGVASYLRIDPASGSVEVGHINFSPLLQRRPAATESMHLMMRRVFELGYRRYEWKCDSLNLPSRAAAVRLGFSYEGVFRQARVTKGRNRDTAWFAIVDREWPALDRMFTQWLDPTNFDQHGRQRTSLRSLTAPLLYRTDPSALDDLPRD